MHNQFYLSKNLFFGLIEFYGKHNIRIKLPMRPLRAIAGVICYTSSSDEMQWCDCVLDESRYHLDEAYEVTLRPLLTQFASEHYYVDDLLHLFHRGHALLYAMDEDGGRLVYGVFENISS